MMQLSTLQIFAIWVLPVLFAITVHEVAHGWVAKKCGDKTAFIMGRLTLNPINHIDLIGTIIVPAVLLIFAGFAFGWAKPVPVNFANLKHPKRDMALVAAAGPGSNLIMAILWGLIAKLGVVLLLSLQWKWALALVYMGQAGIIINIVLMVLNLIPIPPLDGSRIVTSFLSPKLAYKYNRIGPYGFFIILFLLATGLLGHVFFPIVSMLTHSINVILNIPIPG